MAMYTRMAICTRMAHTCRLYERWQRMKQPNRLTSSGWQRMGPIKEASGASQLHHTPEKEASETRRKRSERSERNTPKKKREERANYTIHLKKKRAERAKHTTPPKKKRVKRTPARAHPCQPVLHTRIVCSEHQRPRRAALLHPCSTHGEQKRAKHAPIV